MSSILAGFLWTVCAGTPFAAPATTTKPYNASQYVQPIDRERVAACLKALPSTTRRLIEMYMEAARRDVLSVTDGCFPDIDYRQHYRNLGERAKGAAVLSSLDDFWPDELRRRCRKEAAAFVREVALAHRAKPNLGYEWQAAYVVAENAIAGWFLWDELDADLRDAVAEMVIFQADRFIDVTPNMGFRGDTQAETVSWNSSILTLAVNMMPRHPHHHAWDQAAKRYLYNTLATPQDATDDTLGDDARPIRQWVVGANLYPDLTLENHNQFHIDYVLCAYRYHMQGAALYWLTGRPLPRAIHHHARDLYDKIMLHCVTADGFFAYVSDNDWKRYHCWTESCAVHAYLALLEQHPLAAALEQRALQNAISLWRAFPQGFAYENPYACGKAWTSRIADAVLMHIACPDPLPKASPPEDVETALEGTSRLDTPELLTHHARTGSFASSCIGRGGVWVAYASPRDDAWLLLPSANNYKARINDKAIIQQASTRFQRGPDWFWVSRRKNSTGSAEAFLSLPDGSAVYVQHLASADLPSASQVENSIAVEKPHCPITFHYAGGHAYWHPGQDHWQRSDVEPASSASNRQDAGPTPGPWLNLHDRFGLTVCSSTPDARSEILLPKPGARDAIRIRTATTTADQNLWLIVSPDRSHEDTDAQASQARASAQDKVLVLRIGALQVTFNPAGKSVLPITSGGHDSTHEVAELEPGTVSAWQSGRKLF